MITKYDNQIRAAKIAIRDAEKELIRMNPVPSDDLLQLEVISDLKFMIANLSGAIATIRGMQALSVVLFANNEQETA